MMFIPGFLICVIVAFVILLSFLLLSTLWAYSNAENSRQCLHGQLVASRDECKENFQLYRDLRDLQRTKEDEVDAWRDDAIKAQLCISEIQDAIEDWEIYQKECDE